MKRGSVTFNSATAEGAMAVDRTRPPATATEDDAALLSGVSRTTSEEQPADRAPVTVQLIFLTLVSGVGGFLFGFDTGVISGALPYLRDDLLAPYVSNPSRLNWLQECIVSATVLGAGASSAAGGAFSDACGRRTALLLADLLFAVGSVLLAAATSVSALIMGRSLVGLGVGLAAVVVPAYIAECAPTSIRATLVTANVFMITFGQFAAYFLDYLFTFAPGTWRWMLGSAAVPAVLQLLGLLCLPESPRWLVAKGQTERAQQAIKGLRGGARGDTGEELEGLLHAVAADKADKPAKIVAALKSPVLRYQLHVGVGLQVLQQAAGINTVMYFTPSILELAGFHNKRTALLVAMLPAAVNAAGSIAGAYIIDRIGRRKLLLSSIGGVTVALCMLGGAFRLAESAAPAVISNTCTVQQLADCSACLHAGCSFCEPAGSCQAAGAACPASPAGQQYTTGCPSPYTGFILAGLVAYLVAFSPGLGPVPWVVNAEIFPLQLRGLGSGVAATANWLTNAVVSQTFLTLTHTLGGSGAFWLYACIAVLGTLWAYRFLPETAGLSLEEVQARCEELCDSDRPHDAAATANA